MSPSDITSLAKSNTGRGHRYYQLTGYQEGKTAETTMKYKKYISSTRSPPITCSWWWKIKRLGSRSTTNEVPNYQPYSDSPLYSAFRLRFISPTQLNLNLSLLPTTYTFPLSPQQHPPTPSPSPWHPKHATSRLPRLNSPRSPATTTASPNSDSSAPWTHPRKPLFSS